MIMKETQDYRAPEMKTYAVEIQGIIAESETPGGSEGYGNNGEA